ncbi:MAG: MerR family transcriptional regulator [Verrucomicrobia bacterium]|nr:MerR family transcriptional regulator [Verrucomicrobiota bacterium]MBV8376086.1 MerR family transcriptional regulator [Verrucomicrobiota bacterium]
MKTLQVFEPGVQTVYTIEVAAQLAQVPRRLIVLYYKHGLLSPVTDPAGSGWYFDDEAIRTVRRIEYLRAKCGLNLAGVKLVIGLMDEVERLRAELRFHHRR